MKKWLQIVLSMLAVIIVAGLMFGASQIYSTNARNDEQDAINAERGVRAAEREEISDQRDELILISTSATKLHTEHSEKTAGNRKNKQLHGEFINRAATLIGQLNALEVDGSLEQLRTSISERIRADMRLWIRYAVKKNGPSETDFVTYFTAHTEALATEKELKRLPPLRDTTPPLAGKGLKSYTSPW